MNNKFVKGFLFALLMVYVISPADLAPGPVDDILALLIYLAANKKQFSLDKIGKKNEDIEVLDVDGREI